MEKYHVLSAFGATVSKVVRMVYHVIKNEYIMPPKTEYEAQLLATNFCLQYGFPRCLGAVDETLVVFVSHPEILLTL